MCVSLFMVEKRQHSCMIIICRKVVTYLQLSALQKSGTRLFLLGVPAKWKGWRLHIFGGPEPDIVFNYHQGAEFVCVFPPACWICRACFLNGDGADVSFASTIFPSLQSSVFAQDTDLVAAVFNGFPVLLNWPPIELTVAAIYWVSTKCQGPR